MSIQDQSPLFSTEFFQVLKVPNKGYGAFATKDIAQGTLIMSEPPLLTARDATFNEEYEKMNPQGKMEFGRLCFWWELDNNENMARFQTNR